MRDNETDQHAWDMLDDLQKQTFGYFLELCNPDNGLIPDTTRNGSPCSIAGVGFALSCYPMAVERNYLPRALAAERTWKTLNFFLQSEQNEKPEATGYKGFYYHFLDTKTGQRTWDCELSFIDTGILLAGMCCAAAYFDGGDGKEEEIRHIADKLVNRVDWSWAQNKRTSLSLGWHPDYGFIRYDWEGYNEALLLYVLALGSTQYPLAQESFAAWQSTYQWENIQGYNFLYAGPLFIHFFPQAWLDMRGIQDKFMREKKSDYFENTRRAILIQQSYCKNNPHNFIGYGARCIGVTVDEGPGYARQVFRGEDAYFYGYVARGIPHGPDDGTLAPWACLAALPYNRELGLGFLDYLRDNYPQIIGRYGLKCTFNASFQPPYFPDEFYALDIGISLMMMENARSGLNWELMKKSPIVRRGLERAGFTGGWLREAAP